MAVYLFFRHVDQEDLMNDPHESFSIDFKEWAEGTGLGSKTTIGGPEKKATFDLSTLKWVISYLDGSTLVHDSIRDELDFWTGTDNRRATIVYDKNCCGYDVGNPAVVNFEEDDGTSVVQTNFITYTTWAAWGGEFKAEIIAVPPITCNNLGWQYPPC
mmetsp:Transcript_25983/g.28899  ORF Transcript_25983/g.28899 Transcript_25983/m.28899 type:complete len:158 (+) Transcript_25983:1378-1851(+)